MSIATLLIIGGIIIAIVILGFLAVRRDRRLSSRPYIAALFEIDAAQRQVSSALDDPNKSPTDQS